MLLTAAPEGPFRMLRYSTTSTATKTTFRGTVSRGLSSASRPRTRSPGSKSTSASTVPGPSSTGSRLRFATTSSSAKDTALRGLASTHQRRRGFHASLVSKGKLETFKLADIGEGITECEVIKWYDPFARIQLPSISNSLFKLARFVHILTFLCLYVRS